MSARSGNVAKRRYGRRSVETSHEDKLYFPDAGITKGDVIDYYDRIAERLLPYLKDRPLVVQRFPDGIEGPGFYQKQASEHFPDWIDTVQVELRSTEGTQDLVVCGSRAALGYLVNQACLTLHPWLSRRDALDRPDLMVIDLDPPSGDFEVARVTALRVRALLAELGLPSFPKLTGSKGIHVVVPLDRSEGFDAVRAFARSAAEFLAARYPDELTVEQRREERGGRLFLDVGRNAYGQTAVAPWSVRPLPGAPIAAPLFWRDLAHEGLGPQAYTVKNVFRRTARRSDPWAGLRRRGRSLTRARQALERLHDAGEAGGG
jgi:bifunctional non-homologous end joining protein LigD